MEARKAPLFQPSESKENKDFFEKMTKKAKSAEYFAFPGQVAPIIALTKSLETYRLGLFLAEPGSGKSPMSLEIMNLKDLRDDKKSTHKGAFFTTGKLLAKMAREAYLLHGTERVKCFEVSSDLKYQIDSKTGYPKKFNKLEAAKSKTKKGLSFNGKKIFNISEGDLKESDMRGRNITPLRLKNKKNFTLPKVFPEDIEAMVVPDGMMYIFFFSKDSAKIGLSKQFNAKYGDLCPQCSTPIFSKTFIRKYRVGESYSWKTMLFSEEIKKYKQAKIQSLESGEHVSPWSEFKHQSRLMPKGKPKNCGACDCSLESFTTTLLQDSIQFSKKMANGEKGPRKKNVGERMTRLMKKKIFFMAIVDEVHEMQGRETSQSKLFRKIVQASKSVLVMTGTISNGYPSSIFYILQAIMPKYLKEKGYDYNNLIGFVERYGAIRSTTTTNIKKIGSAKILKVDELPKISESIISLLAPFTYWLQLKDLNLPMPAYEESAHIIPQDPEVLRRLKEFKELVIADIRKYNPIRLKSFAQQFIYLENNPTFPFKYTFPGTITTIDDETGEKSFEKRDFSYSFEPFPEESYFPKEKAMVDYIRAEYEDGRSTLLYSIFNKSVGVSKRLELVIKRELPEVKLERMPDSVSASKLEEWINNHPCDVLIVSPLRVSTGLDLVQFSTCLFYETGANVRTIQQASRRPYRAVGQERDVKIPFFAYQGMQAKLLDLIGKKLKGAATVEGKQIDENQIASVFDDEADYTAILNELANEIEDEVEVDFSSSKIEPGKLRPNTIFEQAYIDILNVALKERGLAKIESTEDEIIEDEIIEDEIIEVEVEKVNIPVDAEKVKIKKGKKTKSGLTQLYFEF